GTSLRRPRHSKSRSSTAVPVPPRRVHTQDQRQPRVPKQQSHLYSAVDRAEAPNYASKGRKPPGFWGGTPCCTLLPHRRAPATDLAVLACSIDSAKRSNHSPELK